jgi:hypothetical protein
MVDPTAAAASSDRKRQHSAGLSNQAQAQEGPKRPQTHEGLGHQEELEVTNFNVVCTGARGAQEGPPLSGGTAHPPLGPQSCLVNRSVCDLTRYRLF